jgi:hypothetical protein
MNVAHRLIVVLGLAFGFQSAAQNYRPFPTDSAFWYSYFLNVQDPWTHSMTTLHYLDGDTVVNGVTYQVLRVNEWSYDHFNEPPYTTSEYFSTGELAAFIRQDTIARTVYIYDLWDETEYLCYDFSIGVGPYPPTYATSLQSEWDVIAVDSVLLGDGYHRRLVFSDDHYLIEGVGRTWGFLPVPGEYQGFVQTLLCQNHQGVQVYTGPIYTGPGFYCGVDLVSVPSSQAAPTMRIFPSPAFDQCQLTNAPPNAAFVIRGMDGRVVLTGRCSGNGQAVIDVSGMPAAMYVVEVNNGAQRVREKLLKQ